MKKILSFIFLIVCCFNLLGQPYYPIYNYNDGPYLQTASSSYTIFYVDTAIGNDNNTSTQAKNSATPWATLNHAAASTAVSSNCMIICTGGEVDGPTIITNKHGSLSQPIIIKSSTSTTYICSNGLSDGSAMIGAFNAGLLVTDCSYINFIGIDGYNNPSLNFNYNAGIAVVAQNTTTYDINFFNCHGVWGAYGFYLAGLNDTPLETNNSIVNSYGISNGAGGFVSDDVEGAGSSRPNFAYHLTNFTAQDTVGNSSFIANGIYLGAYSNVVAAYCTAKNIDVGGSNNTSGGGAGIITQFGNIALILGGEYYNVHWSAVGFEDGNGVDIDNSSYGSIVAGTYSHNNDGPGLYINGSYGGDLFLGNVFVGNCIQPANNQFSEIEYNNPIFTSITNEQILYNTVLALNSGEHTFFEPSVGWTISGSALIANNIMFCSNSTIAEQFGVATGWSNWNNDYYFGAGGSFPIQWNGMTYPNVPNWSSITGQDTAFLTANPNMLNGLTSPTFYPSSPTNSTNWILKNTSALVAAAANLQSKYGFNVKIYQDFLAKPYTTDANNNVGGVNSSQ